MSEENLTLQNHLLKIRSRVRDAANLGILPQEGRDIYEATLIQILNELEKSRQRCVKLAEEYRIRAAKAESEAHAYSQTGSVLFAVVNGYVTAAEREEALTKELDAEEPEDEKVEPKPPIKRKKKVSKKNN